MIIDSRAEFSVAQAVTATGISTRVVDLGAGPLLTSMDDSGKLMLAITCTEAAVGTATHVRFSLESDSVIALNVSPTVHLQTADILRTLLVPGFVVIRTPLPAMTNFERFVGIRYTLVGGALTAGRFNAAIVLDAPTWHAFPDAVN
ncbi:MAG TPA: hypothetical protein DCY89_05560 [Gammaproteobacteria bacterium]|nr:hypothetical protein [Gammaproteobacteria bacterium]